MKLNVLFTKKMLFVLSLLGFFIITSCEDEDDNPVPSSLQVKDFIWKGMNTYYYWQQDVENLNDNLANNQSDYLNFLKSFSTPNDLFNAVRVDSETDRFSVIFSDYRILEGVLSGNTLNNGVDFGLKPKPGSETELFGWVRYIIPGSDAATKDIQRGDIFYAVNGTTLTRNNYQSLLGANTYTLNLADYADGAITPNGQSVTLTKTELQENPILLHSVIQQGTKKIGYLVYNGFYNEYDNQLNAVFGDFLAQGVTDLVLDLRYNSGGSVATAAKLASMITGQFTGQTFAKQKWNSKAQAFLEANNPASLTNKFVGGLNSLNLTKVCILTTQSSASASELVINGLSPYINVVQIGDKTTGKNVGSITLYDSPTFGKTDVNPSHKYAMQPIVLKIANKDNFSDYTNGLPADIVVLERFDDLGILGDPNEPLLETALSYISGSGRIRSRDNRDVIRDFLDSKSMNPLRTEMYVELK